MYQSCGQQLQDSVGTRAASPRSGTVTTVPQQGLLRAETPAEQPPLRQSPEQGQGPVLYAQTGASQCLCWAHWETHTAGF